MKEIVRIDFLPFSVNTDGKLEEGLHSDILSLGSEWVIKKIRPIWQRGNWQERLTQDFQLLDDYLDKFIPSTTLIICSEDGKTKNLLIAQRRVEGRRLRNLSWEEVLNNGRVVQNLIELGECVKQMYESTGMTPDLHGGTKNFLRQYDFKYSNNLLVTAEGQVWWTDVDRLGPLWSPNWIGGKVHMALMMRGFSRFIHQLQGQNHKT